MDRYPIDDLAVAPADLQLNRQPIVSVTGRGEYRFRRSLAHEGVVHRAATDQSGRSPGGSVACAHDQARDTDVQVLRDTQFAERLGGCRRGLGGDGRTARQLEPCHPDGVALAIRIWRAMR